MKRSTQIRSYIGIALFGLTLVFCSNFVGAQVIPNDCQRQSTGVIICPISSTLKSDDIGALMNFLRKNIPTKDPYEKTVDYNAKVDRILNEKIQDELTGKSEWRYYQPVPGSAIPKYNPDTEIYDVTFHHAIPFLTPFRANEPLNPVISFHGDYSSISDFPILKYSESPVSFRINPEDARSLYEARKLLYRITFKPTPPFFERGNVYGLVLKGKVSNFAVVNSATGMVYFEVPSTKPDQYMIVPAAPKGYDRFIGEWSANDGLNDVFFRVTKDLTGRYKFEEGFLSEPGKSKKITWNEGLVMLNGTDSIYLKPVAGKMQARFVSGNFRATHGHDFRYTVTLELLPDGRIAYTLGGDLREMYVATRHGGNR